MTATESQLETMLRAIVANIGRKTPDPAIEYSDDPSPTFTLRVNAADQGRLIGKSGTTIGAIQTLVWISGMAWLARPCSLRLLEPNEVEDRLSPPFMPSKKWDRAKLGKFIDILLVSCFRSVPTAWAIKDETEIESTLSIQLEKYLRPALGATDFVEAFETVVHSAGMALGAKITVEILWR